MGNTSLDWDTISHDATDHAFRYIIDAKEILFQWPDTQSKTPDTLGVSIFIDPAQILDWEMTDMILLPHPVVRVFGNGLSSGDISGLNLKVRGTQAWGENTGDEFEMASHVGDPIEAKPDHYNWLFSVFVIIENANGIANEHVDKTLQTTMSVKVTPRMNLPGGLS